MSKKLFSEFDPVSSKQWKQKIQAELKGADYNDTLVWQSLEGINIRPFYHQDDMPEEVIPVPGVPNSWNVIQHVFIDDETISKNLIDEALSKGAEGIYITAEKPFDFKQIFSDFPWNENTLYCALQFLDKAFLENLTAYFKEKNAKFHLNVDLINHLEKEGNWHHKLEKDHKILQELVQKFPADAIVGVHLDLYQNAGANCVQQLAYALAHANEYLNFLNESLSLKNFKLTFVVGIGGNYFFEIAKLRALRILYATLAEAFQAPIECEILAVPSKRNKTIYDYNVNMLRTTTECMSAVMGGSNAVCNLPYDALYHKSNEFGERISRNQLIILKAESYLNDVSNPAEGSYYIERLTEEFADKALQLFKEIEKGGGLLSQLKQGTLQKKIKESHLKELEWFESGKLTLVGTNKYQNNEDRMNQDLELYPFVKTKHRKTIIEPIIEKRWAETLEKERLSHEK